MSFVVGIDLGTSNCAVAFTDPRGGARAPVIDFPVPQLVRPGEQAARPLFPSVVYLPFEGEFPPGSTAMPWDDGARVTGELARWQAGRVPQRAISSAKSWLIHQGVDRQAPILPWGGPADVPHLSPVAAQAALLSHLAQAWNRAHPEAPLAQQDVVLTIPASFDEAARALTIQAARDAGFDLQRLTLLEEPQAAFYDFTSRHRDTLARALAGVRLVLVVDVGGGTTDFSLVQVAMLPEGPALQRLAVGDHLLLGGDNMDAALAKRLEVKLFPDGRPFSATQWAQAVQQARAAKEAVLSADGPDTFGVSIVSGGSKLIGGTLSAQLTRDEIVQLVVEGFFPGTSPDAAPTSAPRGGVVELGLPFAKDPAITKHLVAFLRAHAEAGFKALSGAHGPGLPRPDAILLNGGVFNSPTLANALVDAVSALFPSAPRIPLLPHDSLDLAVARGAAYSGLARRALGKKIGGGAPRAFYALVGGGAGGKQGLCLVPRGLDEGSTVELKEREFQLTLGRPVQFQLYSTTADTLDAPGALVSLEDERFKPLPPIHTILAGAKGTTIGVHLLATLSEVGTLALSCVAGEQRWRLEFELRGAARSQDITVTEAMPARFAEATTEVERVFGTKPLPVKPQDVKQLFKTLERVLGPRETWGLPVLRELWTALFAGVSKRRRSVDHEKVMFQLLGYALRPGVGYPLDGWRCEQTFTLFKELVTNHGEQAVWSEFWILWRRIASGLNEASQQAIYAVLEPHLARRVPVGLPTPKEKLKGVQPQGLDEMVRCAASLELLPVSKKAELGAWVASRLGAPDTQGGPWAWALGRLGARVPVHGAAHRVVSAETAEAWIAQLLALDPKKHDTAPFALALLARKTGDRVRDVDEATRAKVLARLEALKAPATWTQLVAEVVHLSAADEARALGDTLPVGLSL
ncbi:MAG: hsp70 family protein [Myxococcaceae bacterium]|nr:hsp70 family protein [Myxococcaceae bacterium]